MLWFQRRQTHVPIPQISGINGFEWSEGRRLIADMPYLLPKDVDEISRLDFQHFMLRYALQGNFAAPITNPQSILDVACGTGRWAQEMAKTFPDANVVGFDIVPPPADTSPDMRIYGTEKRPDNYTFVQGNFFGGLPFADNAFDFVHMRLVYAAVPKAQWHGLLHELKRVTQQGGWIELVEGYILVAPGQATNTMQELIVEGNKRRGIDITYGQYIGKLLEQARFKHVQARMVAIPLGERAGGRLGIMAETDIISVFQGISASVTKMGITTKEECDRLIAQMPIEIAGGHISWPVFQAIGQKVKK